MLLSVAALALLLFRTMGDTVVITVDGRFFGEYSLEEDRVVEIRNGDGYNVLVIEEGKASVKRASCPDGICSSHRPIEHNGESIICLPNRVVVEIRTRSQKQPDIIT
ncbi:MAG: NusG domain II-containing protein [Clostridia bacterium]|nr:NusG domain II-containing protein [Clostridia bacterium]